MKNSLFSILGRLDFRPLSEGGCWLWKDGTMHGYGCFTSNSKTFLVHRVMYSFHFKDDIEGLFILHKCDNRLCCNPGHLSLGTHEDNMRDKMNKSRHDKMLSDEEVIEIRRLGDEGKLTHEQISKQFGCSRSNITLILQRKSRTYIKTS